MEGRKLTIDDIARELQISKTTVSRAISGKGRISQETRERVLKYIKENNYRPSAIAKGLAQSKTFNVCFVMPGDYSIVDLPFYQGCLWGISNTASKADYDVIVSMVTGQDISQMERLINNHKVDGVILGRTLLEDKAEAYLKNQEIPFVTVGSANDESVIQVDNDHRSACRELTQVLLWKKLTRIAVVGGNMKYIVNQNRLAGYRDACDEQGVPIDESLIFLDLEDDRAIEEVTGKLIQRKAECIICMDDFICTNVLSLLAREQIRVPEDVKVASFYNSILLGSSQSAITSLQFDAAEMGKVSFNTLLALIDKRETAQRTLLGYEVIVRESTKI